MVAGDGRAVLVGGGVLRNKIWLLRLCSDVNIN